MSEMKPENKGSPDVPSTKPVSALPVEPDKNMPPAATPGKPKKDTLGTAALAAVGGAAVGVAAAVGAAAVMSGRAHASDVKPSPDFSPQKSEEPEKEPENENILQHQQHFDEVSQLMSRLSEIHIQINDGIDALQSMYSEITEANEALAGYATDIEMLSTNERPGEKPEGKLEEEPEGNVVEEPEEVVEDEPSDQVDFGA